MIIGAEVVITMGRKNKRNKKKKKIHNLGVLREKYAIDTLDNLVGDLYSDTRHNWFYSNYKGCGEIDYMGYIVKRGLWDIYEVKTSLKGVKKGIYQIEKAKRCLPTSIADGYIYVINEGVFKEYNEWRHQYG